MKVGRAYALFIVLKKKTNGLHDVVHRRTFRKSANAGLDRACFFAVSMAIEKLLTNALYALNTINFENWKEKAVIVCQRWLIVEPTHKIE